MMLGDLMRNVPESYTCTHHDFDIKPQHPLTFLGTGAGRFLRRPRTPLGDDPGAAFAFGISTAALARLLPNFLILLTNRGALHPSEALIRCFHGTIVPSIPLPPGSAPGEL